MAPRLRKRHLAFEHLDERITMNADMHSSALEEHRPFESRGALNRQEVRGRDLHQVVGHDIARHSERPMFNFSHESQGRSRPARPLRGEGESVSRPAINSSPSIHPNNADLVLANIVLSRPSLVFIEPTNTLAKPSVDLSDLKTDSSSFSTGRVASISIPARVESTNQSFVTPRPATRDLAVRANIASLNGAAAAPVEILSTRPSVIGVSIDSQNASINSKVNSFQSLVASSSATSKFGATEMSRVSVLETNGKNETRTSTRDGMFAFSMNPTSERSTGAKQINASLQSTAGWMNSSSTIGQHASATNKDSAGRLPVPVGMIEIVGSELESSRPSRQATVSKASSNPFEIIQLLIGSTNMMEGGDQLNLNRFDAWQSESVYSEPETPTPLITRNESAVAVAVGTVFVLAMRHDKTRRWIQICSSVRAISKNGRRQSCASFDGE